MPQIYVAAWMKRRLVDPAVDGNDVFHQQLHFVRTSAAWSAEDLLEQVRATVQSELPDKTVTTMIEDRANSFVIQVEGVDYGHGRYWEIGVGDIP